MNYKKALSIKLCLVLFNILEILKTVLKKMYLFIVLKVIDSYKL